MKENFIIFKAIVEKYFEKHIKTIYFDNRGEYISLTTFVFTNGIYHLTTPPHTLEHNGFLYMRHFHIVKTSLTLLSHAFLPLIY